MTSKYLDTCRLAALNLMDNETVISIVYPFSFLESSDEGISAAISQSFNHITISYQGTNSYNLCRHFTLMKHSMCKRNPTLNTIKFLICHVVPYMHTKLYQQLYSVQENIRIVEAFLRSDGFMFGSLLTTARSHTVVTTLNHKCCI